MAAPGLGGRGCVSLPPGPRFPSLCDIRQPHLPASPPSLAPNGIALPPHVQPSSLQSERDALLPLPPPPFVDPCSSLGVSAEVEAVLARVREQPLEEAGVLTAKSQVSIAAAAAVSGSS